MTSRNQTKKALNEFVDPASLALLGGLAAGAYGMYRGVKKGTGARWRTWQNIKKGADIIPHLMTPTVISSNLEQTQNWHKKIAEKYGPTYKFDQYVQDLAHHDAIHAIAPDRQQIVDKFNAAHQTRQRVAANLQAGMVRKAEAQSKNLNPATELFDPAKPHLGTIDTFLADNEPKDINVHGHKIAPPAQGQPREESLHDVLHSASVNYKDPLGMEHDHPGGKRKLTYGDIASMTELERRDASNPEAAKFRETVTRTIIGPKQDLINKLQSSMQSSQQTIDQHRQVMRADKAQQSQDLEMSRAALPSPFEPGISTRQRAGRLVKKLLRNRVTDTIRSSIG